MTTDQFISAASSAGAFLAAIATFLTVIQISKQRRASYKPELVFSRAFFKGTPDDIPPRCPLPIEWSASREMSDESLLVAEAVSVSLTNIGLAAAKNVSIAWSFPISNVVLQINALAQKVLMPSYFELENGILSMNWGGLRRVSSMWDNQRKAELDYVLPAAIEREPTSVGVPNAYKICVGALMYLGFRSEGAIEFPALGAAVEFYDIAGDRHQSAFELAFHFIMVEGSGEHFEAYLEPKKVK